jgi:hypothetical protein
MPFLEIEKDDRYSILLGRLTKEIIIMLDMISPALPKESLFELYEIIIDNGTTKLNPVKQDK